MPDNLTNTWTCLWPSKVGEKSTKNTEFQMWSLSRGRAHCINIAFFRCHMHFSHIAASLYAKWQHQLIQQVMAHWWLLHHSALDLLADSLSSQPWLDPHSLVHMALQVQSVTRTESGWNKCVSYQNFRSPRWYPHPTPSPIKSDPCTLQSVVPCLWISFAYFSEEWLV